MTHFIKQYPIVITLLVIYFLSACIYYFVYRNRHYASISVAQDKMENINIKRRRFENLYLPLRDLLIGTHMLVVETIPYRNLSSKVKRAFIHFKNGKINRGIKLLFQRNKVKTKLDPSIGYLDINEIELIIEKNRSFCDRRLFYLYKEMKNKSEGSKIKEPDELNEEDKKLVMYILEAYDKLKEELF